MGMMKAAIAKIDAIGKGRGGPPDVESTRLAEIRHTIKSECTVRGRIVYIEGYGPVRMMVATDQGHMVSIEIEENEAVNLANNLRAAVGWTS